MNWKHKALWLGSALMLGLGLTGPVVAQTTIGTIDVTVSVSDNGQSMTAGLAAGSSANFGTVSANAAGNPNTGLMPAGTVTLTVQYQTDTKLFRPGSNVNIKLGDGTVSNAYLAIQSVPSFPGSDQATFQIPGRYLSISAMDNPQQLKWTNAAGTHSDPIWTNDGNKGRAHRAAGSETSGPPIYKIGDIGGRFGSSSSPDCGVTSGTALVAWNTAVCGSNTFGESGASHRIAEIHPGSGFVSATHQLQLSLNVPAGVYPETYKGVLTVEQVSA